MKAKGLGDVLTFSENRREAFLSMRTGPKTLDELKELLRVRTNPEVHQTLNGLKNEKMIEKHGETYRLTQLGEIAAHYLKMLYDTTEAIDKHKHFWNTHDLSTIPKEFLARIRELHNCELIQLNNCDLGESHQEFLKNVSNAVSFKGVTCIFIRDWNYLFSDLSEERINIEIIITPEVYAKIKRDYSKELERGLQNPNAHVYVCEEPIGVSFATAELFTKERFFSLSLDFQNGLGHDHKKDLIGFDQMAVKWGDRLFEYYKGRSVEIERIPEQNEFLIYEGKNEVVNCKFEI
jgi:predicted transcriptional regulator